MKFTPEQERSMDLRQILEGAAGRSPGRTAIIYEGRRITFAELEAEACRVAGGLVKLGVKKGDRVAMIQSSNPQFVTTFFGIMQAGGIAVPLDARYVADELASLFDDCRPKVLFVEDPPLESLKPAMPRYVSLTHIVNFAGMTGGRYIPYKELLTAGPTPGVSNDPDDAAVISYTGGPTLRPHGVVLSHRSIGTEAVNSAAVFRQTEDDVLLQFALPFYHQFGLTAVLLASIHKGSAIATVPGTGRSIHSFMQAVEREKGTMYMGVPYIYSLMINVARREGIKHDLSSLRLCISGGAPLEPVVIDLFRQHYGFKILDIYGQTESVSQITVSPIDGTGPVGSSGKPMPCWEIKIFDENDNELPPDQEGEIVARGPVMTGFYNRPAATARALRNGWLHTGDIGRLDRDGFLFITARQRRMLILKGQNIFPEDIEAVLVSHPAIAAAKVLGVSDIIRGETVKALVRLEPGKTASEAEIRQYCQGRMADYKLPRDIEFVKVMPESVPNWTRPDPATEFAMTGE
jgi:long-chain acyl-CoA synthetase